MVKKFTVKPKKIDIGSIKQMVIDEMIRN